MCLKCPCAEVAASVLNIKQIGGISLSVRAISHSGHTSYKLSQCTGCSHSDAEERQLTRHTTVYVRLHHTMLGPLGSCNHRFPEQTHTNHGSRHSLPSPWESHVSWASTPAVPAVEVLLSSLWVRRGRSVCKLQPKTGRHQCSLWAGAATNRAAKHT